MNIISFLTTLLSIAVISESAFIILPELNTDVDGTLPLITNEENQLIGTISIGNPPQNINVLFNVSSSNLIVYGNDFQLNPSISIASGPPNGFLATSSVVIGGLNITGQEFILTLGSSPYPNVGGVFGLGYTEAGINNSPSPLYNIIAQNLISDKLFSIHLQPTASSNTDDNELYLGAIDTSLQLTQWVYANSTNGSDWQFNVTTNYINDTVVSYNSATYLSTSSNAIAVPDDIFANLQQYLGIQANESGDYTLPCDTPVAIFTFQLDNKNLTLFANDFMANDSQDSSTSLCTFNIQNSGSDVWRLGTPFLAKYYTVFNVTDTTISFGEYLNETPSTTTTTTTASPVTSPIAPPEPPEETVINIEFIIYANDSTLFI